MAGSNIRIIAPGVTLGQFHDKMVHRDYPEQHPLESIYRASDKVPLTELLKETPDKGIVFVMPDKVLSGVQDPIVRFPYPGVIVGCFAFCKTPGGSETIIEIEKISQENFMLNRAWTNIFSKNLNLPANVKFSSESTKPYELSITSVSKYDYFRVKVTPGTNIMELTVQLDIKLL